MIEATMRQYAIRAMADEPVGMSDLNIALDTGFNVFNVVTDELDQILCHLRDRGVQILDVQMMQQDFKQSLEDLLVPGESQEALHVFIPAQRVEESEKA